MIHLDCDDHFSLWRQQARWLLSHQIGPERVSWATATSGDLFASEPGYPETAGPFQGRIPMLLLELLENASRYRGDQRWSVLYEVLWRVSHGDRTAMLPGDALGSELHRRIKRVSREAHHLHAFLRFVALPQPGAVEDEAERAALLELDRLPHYVAWHEPAHDILASASGHFAQRMGELRWLIATPSDAVYYNGRQLEHRRQCPPAWARLAREAEDPQGELWLTYYSHIFNPARLNPKVMQGHLPARFWKNLPEGPLIPALISEARVGKQRDGQARAIGDQEGKRILRGPVSR